MVQSALRLHFYVPGAWMPWWLRIPWRPVFSHVSVEPIPGAIHDLPKDGPTGWWHTAAHRLERPPTVTVTVPARYQYNELAALIEFIGNQYHSRKIEKIRCVLWHWHLWRRRRPRSCATLAVLWLTLATWGRSMAATPDELYQDLLRQGYAGVKNDGPTV